MKNPNPSNVPQTEGHPDPFPEVTTMPKGWDLSEMVTPPVEVVLQAQSIPLELDLRTAVDDRLA